MEDGLNPEDYNIHDMVTRYREMKHFANSLYLEAMWQYRDMARGGDGGVLDFMPRDWAQRCVDAMRPVDEIPSIREYNYPDKPDSYFLAILEGLGEDY